VSFSAVARRLFTLSGVAPLGAFLVLHAITNARAVRGETAFVAAVHAYERVPALTALEILFVYAPLLFHTAYGVWLVATRKPLAASSPFAPPWKLAVRATGVVAALFLVLHLPELRFRTPGARPSGGQLLTWLAADLSRTSHGWPLVAAAYLFACACATFHFAAGSWGVFASTRFASEDPHAKRRSAWAAALGGVALFVVFANTVVLHATGSRLFGSASAEGAGATGEPSPSAACPPRAATRP
jgi:succinate dehydrogenase / fumarate reductase cytochrome b subunit